MLLISILYLLLSNSFSDKHIPRYNNRSLILILLSSAYITTLSLNIGIDKGVGIFGGLFNITVLGNLFNGFILLISLIIVLLTSFYPIKERSGPNFDFSNIYNSNKYNTYYEYFKITEYPLILAFIVTGAIFLITSGDLVSLFITIELQSYGLYLFSTIHRNSESSTSAGLMYFLLGGLSSCFILLGSSLLYINNGTTGLEDIYILFNISQIYSESHYNIISYSILILCIGLLFKISAAPFHFWSIDVYNAIPTVVTTFVAIVPKISIFIFMFSLVSNTIWDSSDLNVLSDSSVYNIKWTQILLISSVLSLIIGTILGLNQTKIKKLFAYSTISHVGFILLSLTINNVESTQAFLFYIIQYSISNLNLFIILLTMGYILNLCINEKDREVKHEIFNSPLQKLSQIKGFFFINPLLSISFAITIYSMIGIPPLIGFFGKQMVLSSAINNNYTFIVFIAILTSVIGAVYYLNIIKLIFFDKPDKNFIWPYITLSNYMFDDTEPYIKQHPGAYANSKTGYQGYRHSDYYIYYRLSGSLSITISILTLIIILFIFSPEQILNLVNILAIMVYS